MIAKKTSKTKRLVWVGTSLLGLALIGVLIFSTIKVVKKRMELTNRIDSLKKEIQTLEKEKKQLQKGANINAIESELRKIGYEKQGEKKIVIKKEGEVEPPKTENLQSPKKEEFWQKVLKKIKSIF